MKKTAAEKARDKSKVKEHPITELAFRPMTDAEDAAEQKNKLVDDILNIFTDPNDWPMNDSHRIGFIKDIYRQARKIRDTENAIKAAS